MDFPFPGFEMKKSHDFPSKNIFCNSQKPKEKNYRPSAIGFCPILVGISAIDFCPIVISQKPFSFYSVAASRRN